MRKYFVLPCTLSLTVFVRLYLSYDVKSFSSFLSSLLLKSCGCFSPHNFQSFSHCFLFRCFIRRHSHPRVEYLDLASHSFQFGFARATFPIYSFSLQEFAFFFTHSNTVKSCVQAYVLQYPPKILYFFSKKEKLQYRFRFDLAIKTIFLLQTIYQGQISSYRA